MQLDKYAKIGIVIIVIAAVAGVIAYTTLSTSGGGGDPSLAGKPVSQAQLSAMYGIANNASLAKAVGEGVVSLFPHSINSTPLSLNGKPEVLYIGANYCPFCAATRWGIVLALMRFGNFTSLNYMTSSSSDVFPNTATFSFYNSTYSSSVISFVPVETLTNVYPYKQLQNLTQQQNKIISMYSNGGAIPFIDFGNASIESGSAYSPGIINKYDWQQIISQLDNANGSVSQAVIGTADVFTAQICKMTNFTPARVCSAPYIKNVLAGG